MENQNSKSYKPILITIGVVLIALLTIIAVEFVKMNDRMEKIDIDKKDTFYAKKAYELDITVKDYKKLEKACAAYNYNINKIEDEIKTVRTVVREAANGNRDARELLYTIGLSWRDMDEKSGLEQWLMFNKSKDIYVNAFKR